MSLCMAVPKTTFSFYNLEEGLIKLRKAVTCISMLYSGAGIRLRSGKMKSIQGRVQERWIPSCPSLVDPLGQQFILPHRRDMCQVMPTGDANLGRGV